MSFELDSTSKDFVAGVRFYVYNIVKMHLCIDKNVESFSLQMLQVDPNQRIKLDEIEEHDFFTSI